MRAVWRACITSSAVTTGYRVRSATQKLLTLLPTTFFCFWMEDAYFSVVFVLNSCREIVLDFLHDFWASKIRLSKNDCNVQLSFHTTYSKNPMLKSELRSISTQPISFAVLPKNNNCILSFIYFTYMGTDVTNTSQLGPRFQMTDSHHWRCTWLGVFCHKLPPVVVHNSFQNLLQISKPGAVANVQTHSLINCHGPKCSMRCTHFWGAVNKQLLFGPLYEASPTRTFGNLALLLINHI